MFSPTMGRLVRSGIGTNFWALAATAPGCMDAGFTGYASYAPSKWAVRGLCDCLRNEVSQPARHKGIAAQLCGVLPQTEGPVPTMHAVPPAAGGVGGEPEHRVSSGHGHARLRDGEESDGRTPCTRRPRPATPTSAPTSSVARRQMSMGVGHAVAHQLIGTTLSPVVQPADGRAIQNLGGETLFPAPQVGGTHLLSRDAIDCRDLHRAGSVFISASICS